MEDGECGRAGMTNIIVKRAVVIVKSHMGIKWSPGSRYRAVSCKGFSSSALTCENVEGFVGSWKHASKSEVLGGGGGWHIHIAGGVPQQ